jgi:murein DD-endopeptidase MepM/ murein hydrolase activator NlpD
VLLHKKTFLLILALSLAACLPQGGDLTPALVTATQTPGPSPTPSPSRPEYDPGELVDYVAQTGDTLPALAARFNTTIREIRDANPDIPADATTMPPGMPMKIPIYYLPFWGTTFQILPDSQFVNGPAAIGFDTGVFVASHPGWLKDFRAYAVDANHSGAEIVNIVATDYSISPRVLLAILEYQTGALSQPVPPSGSYPLGEVDYNYDGLYLQLIWAATMLNNGYYGWRTGSLTEFEHLDGNIERPDPWQTAATVAFQYYFSLHNSSEDYARAIGPGGLAHTYQALFGDPWAVDQPHIPVSLQQPELTFPFPAGDTWTLTGGPHNGWGNSLLLPWAALDFGPPDVHGCASTIEVATAVASGVVVRSETGVVMLDLDSNGDERTGWDILYLHVGTVGRASVGQRLKVGDPVGYPSCEGGEATGTHIHIARKYNGEWIPVDSAISFNLDGWIAHIGNAAYQGTLTRGNQTVIACDCSDAASEVKAGK